jgi:hypothetical protein
VTDNLTVDALIPGEHGMRKHGVIIVGARCAGAPVAMLLARKGLSAARSGALSFLGTGGEDRLLRVQLYAHTTSWILTLERARHLVAILAHELQHVLEVATADWVRDQGSFVALFQAIGVRQASNQNHTYDTDAAREVGRRVRDEVRGLRSDIGAVASTPWHCPTSGGWSIEANRSITKEYQ